MGKHKNRKNRWEKLGYQTDQSKALVPVATSNVVVCRPQPQYLLHQSKPRHGEAKQAFLGELEMSAKWEGLPVRVDFYHDGGYNTYEGTIVKVLNSTNAKVQWR